MNIVVAQAEVIFDRDKMEVIMTVPGSSANITVTIPVEDLGKEETDDLLRLVLSNEGYLMFQKSTLEAMGNPEPEPKPKATLN